MGQSDIPFSNAARNLGVILDSRLILKEQMKKVCQLAYLEIRRIGSIRQYLPFEAKQNIKKIKKKKNLLSFLVPSRLDYCKAKLTELRHLVSSSIL